MVGIGKEKPKLKAKAVVIENYEIVNVPAKEGTKMRDAKDKIVLHCRHPDKSELIDLSRVKYEKGNKMQQSALWMTLDDEENISHDSALANLLRFYGLNNLEELTGKTIQTVTDADSGFLIIKAY